MKLPALSFWQPYAWLIVNGVADVDSRLWSPPEKYVGQRIAIHASKKKVTKEGYAEFTEMMDDLAVKRYPKSPDDFDYGAIVGSVVISAVTKNSKSYFAAPEHFHWKLSGAKKIKPLATIGSRGWFFVQLPEKA